MKTEFGHELPVFLPGLARTHGSSDHLCIGGRKKRESGGETQENRCKDDPHCSTTCSMAQSAAIFRTQEVNVAKIKTGFSLTFFAFPGFPGNSPASAP